MNEVQAKRNLGRGMKPRGIRGSDDPNDLDVSAYPKNGPTENQQLTESEIVSEAADQRDQPDSTVPSPEDGFQPVAQMEEKVGTSEVPQEKVGDFQELANLMKKSAEHNEAEISAGMANLLGVPHIPTPGEETGVPVDSAEHVSEFGIYIPTKEEIAAIEQRAPIKQGGYDIHSSSLPTIADLEEAMKQGSKVDIRPSGEVIITPPLGDQPDGTFKIVVTIPEGYIESIRQQAEIEHETPEQWASKNYSEYLASWWAPPRTA